MGTVSSIFSSAAQTAPVAASEVSIFAVAVRQSESVAAAETEISEEIQTIAELEKLIQPGANQADLNIAYTAFLQKAEVANPDKYREIVEIVKKELAQNSGDHQFETSPIAWRLAWVAREAYAKIPLPAHDLIPEEAMRGLRNGLIKNFTPEDCTEPSQEMIAFVRKEIQHKQLVLSNFHAFKKHKSIEHKKSTDS
jgi:hypothetical protein